MLSGAGTPRGYSNHVSSSIGFINGVYLFTLYEVGHRSLLELHPVVVLQLIGSDGNKNLKMARMQVRIMNTTTKRCYRTIFLAQSVEQCHHNQKPNLTRTLLS